VTIWDLAFLHIAFWGGYFVVNGAGVVLLSFAIAVYILNVLALTIQ